MRLLLVDHGLEQLGDSQRAQLGVALDQHGAVGAEGQGGAQLFLGGVRANRNHHHFAGDALLLQAHRFLHGDLAEGIERHLHVG
ncbi:hypothetical protein D3C81_1979940 [compost metagenome]